MSNRKGAVMIKRSSMLEVFHRRIFFAASLKIWKFYGKIEVSKNEVLLTSLIIVSKIQSGKSCGKSCP